MHNNKKYYGNRDIVYKSIFVLNDLKELCNNDFENNAEHIILSGNLPNYLINKYKDKTIYLI